MKYSDTRNCVVSKKCPICKSTHTGINRLPNGNYILHCDESCGAIWDTETTIKENLMEERASSQ